MKLSFKQLLIVFLCALLGAGIGTFTVLEVTNNSSLIGNEKPLIINQVTYDRPANSSYENAINKAYDTVVQVITTKKSNNYYFGTSETTGAGSGVIISSDGYIVTNWHVVKDTTSVKVKLNSGEELDAKVIGSDSRTDLALIKIEANNLRYSSFADSDALIMGQDVVAIGNPLGEGITASTGIISALEKEIYLNEVYMDLLQTDASINEGNSGGGLFDLEGNIVGIVNAKSSDGYNASVEGMGYAIPANRVVKIISDIKEYGYVKNRATLGVKVGTYAYSYYYQNTRGLLVTEVLENGGAKNAGMKENDRILEVDGTEINSYASLNKVLDKHEIGDTVKVVVQRDDKQLTLDVTLTEAMQ